MSKVINPVLRGFSPDPCICRGKDAWYIAVSTFEWYPGVLIYESHDFVNWNLKKAPLERISQLNLVGEQPSGGIWAPALSYHDGLYYLVYTDTKMWKGEHQVMPFRDMHNYFVTATDIEGPWSEPIYLISGGYDPSLFHDDDGKQYLLYIRRDYRGIHNDLYEGIILKEYCKEQQKLIGEEYIIYEGANLEIDYFFKTQIYEAPHILKKDGWYYLITAEGGTGYTHSTCVSRSKNILGPYEFHPNTPMLSSRHTERELQKTGHGTLVEGPGGQWYMSFLCSRPISGKRISPLGRESGITPIEWSDDWPYIKGGGIIPPKEFDVESENAFNEDLSWEIDFSKAEKLPVELQSLRIPFSDYWCKLDKNIGALIIKGQESPYSRFYQSVVGSRIRNYNAEITTSVYFQPTTYQQTAGLMLRYDEETWYYLMVTGLDTKQRGLCYMQMIGGAFSYKYDIAAIDKTGDVHMKAVINEGVIKFYFSQDAEIWIDTDITCDFHKLCDEFAQPVGFTGSFACMHASDMVGSKKSAAFKYFKYKEMSCEE